MSRPASVIGLACAVAFAGCAATTPPPGPTGAIAMKEGKGSISTSAVVNASATVEAIDQKSRMVTLRRSDGERVRFRVSDDVKNLAQVKKGEVVNVTFYESVALRLRKPGEAAPGVTVAEDAERAKPGEMPAAASAEVVTVTSKVVAIDRKKHTVTLEMANKDKLSVKVTDAARLDKVKVGDLVEATYREAIAVAVDRPAR